MGAFTPPRRDAREAVHTGGETGMRRGMEHLLGESRRVVPIEEGTLERSGRASTDGSEDGLVEGAVSYDTPYAVRQHEEQDWQHDAGRQSKYLEGPRDAERVTIAELLAHGIREEFEDG